MALSIALLHQRPEYSEQCCDLLNQEWKRSTTARMRSFENSCDTLPANIILLDKNQLIGHLKLSVIPSIPMACFVECVVIQNNLRGKGYGTKLMEMSEDYCKNVLDLKEVYLSTKGQEEFYRKLGYEECPPISIYGFCTNVFDELIPPRKDRFCAVNNSNTRTIEKTYMKKIF